MRARVVQPIPQDVLERMVERLRLTSVKVPCLRPEVDPHCWVRTTAALNGDLSTYTSVTSDGFRVKGHYASYQARNGLISDPYLVLDHLCWTAGCWNPAHVEPVTQAVNNGRRAPHDDGRYRLMGARKIVWGNPVTREEAGA